MCWGQGLVYASCRGLMVFIAKETSYLFPPIPLVDICSSQKAQCKAVRPPEGAYASGALPFVLGAGTEVHLFSVHVLAKIMSYFLPVIPLTDSCSPPQVQGKAVIPPEGAVGSGDLPCVWGTGTAVLCFCV